MKLSIRQPLGYSYLGGRGNNEDTIFPAADEATLHQRWFMVCDGVGGAARGEIASHIAVESFNDYFTRNQEVVATPAYIQSALDYVQNQFDDYLTRHPEAHGMATTLTVLFFHEAGATVAHIGDSRVYHLRNGEVIWRTEDHSLVNQLVRAGVITPEEAHEHPQRNVIERAIQGSSKLVKPDVQLINDIRPDDYFFLCTDGVLERVSDELLENVLGSNASNEQKKQTLIDCCTGKTKDNFSAYLVQVESVSGNVAQEYRMPMPAYSRPKASLDETVAVVAIDSRRTIQGEENEPQRSSPVRMEDKVAKRYLEESSQKDQKEKPRSDTDSILMMLAIALLAAVLTIGGVSVYKWWKQPEEEAGKAEQVAADHGKTNNRPRKNHALPPIQKSEQDPVRSQTSDEAALEGITQVIGEEGGIVGITDHLYKKHTENGWILLNEKGRQKGNKVYEEIREPNDKLIAVRQKSKWGYINLNGQTAITCQFDEASDFENGKAHVLQKGKEYDIDKKGKKVDQQPVLEESVGQNKLPDEYSLITSIGEIEGFITNTKSDTK